MKKTPSERFWTKVDQSGECWLWLAAKKKDGYGQFHFNGWMQNAHRVGYMLSSGPIPEGMQVDHTCHNRACVKLEHLRLVTGKQNMENRLGAREKSASGVRGVSWCKAKGKWHAYVGHNRKQINLGFFARIEDAEAAAVAKRLELFTHDDIDRTTYGQVA